MQILQKCLDYSERFLVAVCAAAFFVMFVLGIATVVFRFLLDSSLAFPDELIRYLFIWIVALGSAVAFRRNMHAAIGVVVANLPASPRRAALLFATATSAFFFIVILRSGIEITVRVWPQISPALEISMAWVYGAVPAGMALLLVYSVELFVKQWRTPAAQLLAEGN